VNVHGAPAGQAPLEQQGRTQQVSGIETQRLPPSGSALKRWLPGLVILLIVILLPSVYLLRQWRQPTASVPTAPSAPERPVIPQPPQPPQPPAGPGTGAAIDPNYLYPGARQTMIISKPGKNVLQLETEDSLDKVADWYIEKFKPTEIVRRTDTAVLRGEKVAIILNSNGKGTSIMLTAREN
jgi:hypothetical protein